MPNGEANKPEKVEPRQVASNEVIAAHLESQHKLLVLLLVLVAVALVWLACITARVYGSDNQAMGRGYMHNSQGQYGSGSNLNGNDMMNGSGGTWQFR